MNSPHSDLDSCPLVISWPVGWGEMDAFAHLNNAVYFRYFEHVRIEYFKLCGLLEYLEEFGVGPILGHTSCRFRRPINYPDNVWIGTTVSEIGEDRFIMQYKVVSQKQNILAAEGDGRIVIYDYKKGAKAPLPDVVKEKIRKLENNPPQRYEASAATLKKV